MRAREWSREVEAASTSRRHPGADEAAARFDALASVAQKMALAREIVETRAAELTLAYRNLVMVTAGFKSRGDAGGVEQVHPEPCVVFVVRRKWAPGRVAAGDPELPRRLLTYGQAGAQRRLYAVPTDVQPAQWYAGGTARSANCVRVDDPVPAFTLPGTLACAVSLDGAVHGDLVLSAMHVLNPVPQQALPTADAPFRAEGGGAAIRGRSAAWGGHLDAASGSAFDVQLATLADRAWFNAAFDGWKLSARRPYVAARDVFDELAVKMRFRILAADNHPSHGGAPREAMLAQFTAMVHEEFPIVYQLRPGGAVQRVRLRHRELIRMQVLDDSPAPLSGDSGSPVISWWDDGSVTLVGLFIASGGAGGERVAYAIPAWELFDPANWDRLPAGTTALTPRLKLR